MQDRQRDPGFSLGLIAALGALFLSALGGCSAADPPARRTGSPVDDLPPHIVRLTESGMRPDWSADGTRLLFLDALVGDVFELELESERVRPLTKHYPHSGYSRELRALLCPVRSHPLLMQLPWQYHTRCVFHHSPLL